MTAWLILAGSAVVIVYAGTKLSRYGDDIADLTGLGRLWIGVVLMAAATSLPELFTTVSAAWIDAPDLAAGDLLGAGMANMFEVETSKVALEKSTRDDVKQFAQQMIDDHGKAGEELKAAAIVPPARPKAKGKKRA